MKRVQMRMKTTKDTRCECLRRDQDLGLYFGGYTRPHFPMPAVPVRIVHSKWRIWAFMGVNTTVNEVTFIGKYLTSWRYHETSSTVD